MKGLIFLVFSCFSVVGFSSSYEKSFVHLTSYVQKPDYDALWRKQQVETKYFTGVIISKDQILVGASAVAFSSHIEMKRIASTAAIVMEVEFVDYAANLAILRPKSGQPITDFHVLPMATPLSINEGSNQTAD